MPRPNPQTATNQGDSTPDRDAISGPSGANPGGTGRRRFLVNLAAAAGAPAVLGSIGDQAGSAARGAAPDAQTKAQPDAKSKGPRPQAAPLPSIQLGKYRISRLVVGANPIHGYSYLGPHVTQHMQEWFALPRAAEFLLDCERAGITAHQFSDSPGTVERLRSARELGSKMRFLALHSKRDKLAEFVRDTRPIAVAHHGGATDTLFAQGKAQDVHDYVKAVHDLGLLAGVSAHNPDNIKRVADEGWEVDYFMTCFYFVSRKRLAEIAGKKDEEDNPILEVSPHTTFHRDDPANMTAVVRQVRQPCLGFKILAAGRQCSNQDVVRRAFRYALTRIKPIDGVIVGMFPWAFDEVGANAGYAREYGVLPPVNPA
jgi:hypothetical protein